MPDDRDRRNDMYIGMGTTARELQEELDREIREELDVAAGLRQRENERMRETTSEEELSRSRSPFHDDNWEARLRRYMEDLYQARANGAWNMSYDMSINTWNRNLHLNDNIPVFHVLENKDTEEMPLNRLGIACQNCGHGWGVHASWACPHFYRADGRQRRWNKSLLSPKDRYLTPDMKKAKKYSRISKRRLQKMTREQMLSKESLLK